MRTPTPTHKDIHSQVQAAYGQAATAVAQGRTASCGTASTTSPASCCGPADGRTDPVTRDLYDPSQQAGLPADAVAASLGCGNPTALATLEAGEIVLDLGSGGGIDVLLSAQRVGPTGHAYGLDMTPEMLALAQANKDKAGATNATFLRGNIEAIPLPDNSVDVIISNCVVNLSPDKDAVFAEALRVLKPGGRIAISDIVWTRPIDPQLAASMEAWVGCVAGALTQSDYLAGLQAAGFEDTSIEPTRTYTAADAEDFLGEAAVGCCGVNSAEFDGALISGFVRARKPAA